MRSEIEELIKRPWSSYDEAKIRSEEIDRLLGFQISAIEAVLRTEKSDFESWVQLSPQGFQTPYPELYDIVQSFRSHLGLRWCDFGCAYGRLGLILNWFRSQDDFVGYEFAQARVVEGNRVLQVWCGSQSLLQHVDLRKSAVPVDFDIAFLYDFGRPDEVSSFLHKLRLAAKERPITIIGRGRATRHLIATEHAWLSEVEEPVHTAHWSCYRSSAESPEMEVSNFLRN